MRTYLVTGGAGFIGSHIAHGLARRGDRVRVLDDLSGGRRENLASIQGSLEFIEASVTDRAAVARAVEGVDCVFHQAALASVPLSVEDPLRSHEVCTTGTLAVLDAARRAGVRRVVFAASSAAYGDTPTSSKREQDLAAPLSPYGAFKVASEYYCQAFHATYGLETVCLRYFNIFGPRQDPDSPYSAVIPLFITAMLSGRQPTVYGDGLQPRDFCYVGNVVDANLLAADAAEAPGKTFNIASGTATTLLQLMEILNRLLKTNVQPHHAPPRAGDIKESLADITLARRLLGYDPQVGFEQGLEQSIEYYRQLVEGGRETKNA